LGYYCQIGLLLRPLGYYCYYCPLGYYWLLLNECPQQIPLLTNPFDAQYGVSIDPFLQAPWTADQHIKNVALFLKSSANKLVKPNGVDKHVTNAQVTNFGACELQIYAWEEADGQLAQIPINNVVLFQSVAVAMQAGGQQIGTLPYQLRFTPSSSWKIVGRPVPNQQLAIASVYDIPLPPPPPPPSSPAHPGGDGNARQSRSRKRRGNQSINFSYKPIHAYNLLYIIGNDQDTGQEHGRNGRSRDGEGSSSSSGNTL
jgi:hypothetical protein